MSSTTTDRASAELYEHTYEQCGDVTNLWQTAQSWHGGQFSALYSFASTGEIHGVEHQFDLVVEIEHNLRTLTTDEADEPLRRAKLDFEIDALTYLLTYVQTGEEPV